MEWVFWVTALCAFLVCVLFVVLYGWTDMKCVWPPCLSELMEVHKTVILLFFGFACGLLWLNLVLIGLLRHSDNLVGLGTMVYFSVMGIMSFDVSEHIVAHYCFVMCLMMASLLYVNIAVVSSNLPITIAVNVLTTSFIAVSVLKMVLPCWTAQFKYVYTLVEIGWVASFFCYTLINSYLSKNDFDSLLTVHNETLYALGALSDHHP